jgi:energy-coupling factor transporter ATP-binding protein EcfA2
MKHAIEIDSLDYSYADGTEALRKLSLRVAPGECVGLLGSNGSGKSTLLLHLNGILPERHGRSGPVRINGQILHQGNLDWIRQQVGLLFQDPDDQLFCATVGEDVAFGPMQLGLPREEIDRRVKAALAQVGLLGYERRAPQHLSQGEKRRACLAGVLSCQPSILALDEPTSGLDPRSRREFKSILRDVPATKLVASHDLELILEFCPRSIILDDGRIVAEGPTFELMADEELMLAHGLERPHMLDHMMQNDVLPWSPTLRPPST